MEAVCTDRGEVRREGAEGDSVKDEGEVDGEEEGKGGGVVCAPRGMEIQKIIRKEVQKNADTRCNFN